MTTPLVLASRPVRMQQKPNYVAAWVPFEGTRPISDAADLGIDWVLEQAASRGIRPALVTDQFESGHPDRLLQFGRTYGHATTRSQARLGDPHRSRPTLAYVPTESA